jgi:hypothetical protein
MKRNPTPEKSHWNISFWFAVLSALLGVLLGSLTGDFLPITEQAMTITLILFILIILLFGFDSARQVKTNRKHNHGWLGATGILTALRRRAIEGGGYRVTVSLTRTVLWILSLGIFDKAYAQATAGSTDEHTYIAPDLFTAETPLGPYQGMTDQIVMSRTMGAFRTVLAPRGSSKPEWFSLRK